MTMCAERMWYVFLAIILGLVMGLTGSQLFGLAFVIQLAVMVVLFVRAFTDGCPSLTALKRILPPCDDDEDWVGA